VAAREVHLRADKPNGEASFAIRELCHFCTLPSDAVVSNSGSSTNVPLQIRRGFESRQVV
jgi:hypothetical protein